MATLKFQNKSTSLKIITPASLFQKLINILASTWKPVYYNKCFIILHKYGSEKKHTHSTSRNGKVTVFQKSYPYSQVTLKCSSNSSSISGLYCTVTVFHMKFFCNRPCNQKETLLYYCYLLGKRSTSIKATNCPYRWILATVVTAVGILSQRAASVQLDQEFVIVPTGTVDVHAVRIVSIACEVELVRMLCIDCKLMEGM